MTLALGLGFVAVGLARRAAHRPVGAHVVDHCPAPVADDAALVLVLPLVAWIEPHLHERKAPTALLAAAAVVHDRDSTLWPNVWPSQQRGLQVHDATLGSAAPAGVAESADARVSKTRGATGRGRDQARQTRATTCCSASQPQDLERFGVRPATRSVADVGRASAIVSVANAATAGTNSARNPRR